MSLRSRRHPALETAVFAAALLLSAFIAREFWHRRSAAQPPAAAVARTTGRQPAVLTPSRPPLPLAAGGRRTEVAVTGVAPLKLTRVQRRRPKPDAVPVPK